MVKQDPALGQEESLIKTKQLSRQEPHHPNGTLLIHMAMEFSSLATLFKLLQIPLLEELL